MDAVGAKGFVRAIVGVLLFLVAVRVIYVAATEPRNLSRPAYILQGLVNPHPSGGAPLPAEPTPDWSVRLPAADWAAGKIISAKCAVCHDLSPARRVKFGPPLYGVVGRPRGAWPGYGYSPAMKAAGGDWSADNLFEFLRDPQLAVPNTRMGFEGIKDPQTRVDLIAYLRANAPAPATPLPR